MCREGIEAALLQRQDDGRLRLVSAASRALSTTEKRYATIEQEALGVVWAYEKFKQYIIGLKVAIKTNHKPFVPLLNNIEIDKLPARIQRFRTKLMRFDYHTDYIPGKDSIIADDLSCSCAVASNEDHPFTADVELHASSALHQTAPAARLHKLSILQREDEVLARVIHYVLNGWPAYLLPIEILLHPYFENHERLSLIEAILALDSQIIIPQVNRLEVLNQVHPGHPCITKCCERARQSVWWPEMSQQL